MDAKPSNVYHDSKRHAIGDRCCTLIRGVPYFYTVTDLRPCDLDRYPLADINTFLDSLTDFTATISGTYNDSNPKP